MLDAIKARLLSHHVEPDTRCKWCHHRIGFVTHGPVPLCRKCMTSAEHDTAPGRPTFTRMATEFRSEFSALVHQGPRSMTSLDTLQASADALADTLQMGARVDALRAAGKAAEAEQLQAEMQRRLGDISEFRRTAPALVAQVEKADRE